jgi:hypothetical protein
LKLFRAFLIKFLFNPQILRNLKKLNLDNLTGVKNKEFISILLEDEIENLLITGSEHLNEDKVKDLEKSLSAKPKEKTIEN